MGNVKSVVSNCSEHTNFEPSRSIKKIDPETQRKILETEYSLKVVVRGERGTGKSALIRRLQGKDLLEKYYATSEIQTSHISWKNESSNDQVKVEVWDIVDVAQISSENLSVENSETGLDANVLEGVKRWRNSGRTGSCTLKPVDAEMIDVYKGAHVAIFMLDRRKRSTLEYVRKKLPNVPASVIVLLLVNFFDVVESSDSTTSKFGEEDINALVNNDILRRSKNNVMGSDTCIAAKLDAQDSIFWFNSSMKNCFGLSTLHKLLNIPFIYQQKSLLLHKLEQVNFSLEKSRKDAKTCIERSNYAEWKVFWEKTRKKEIEKMQKANANSTSAPPKNGKLNAATATTTITNAKDKSVETNSEIKGIKQEQAPLDVRDVKVGTLKELDDFLYEDASDDDDIPAGIADERSSSTERRNIVLDSDSDVEEILTRRNVDIQRATSKSKLKKGQNGEVAKGEASAASHGHSNLQNQKKEKAKENEVSKENCVIKKEKGNKVDVKEEEVLKKEVMVEKNAKYTADLAEDKTSTTLQDTNFHAISKEAQEAVAEALALAKSTTETPLNEKKHRRKKRKKSSSKKKSKSKALSAEAKGSK
eukprot:g5.t1